MKTFFFLFLCSNLCFSQLGIGTNAPNSSSMLEVKSTERGFLAPRMSYNQITTIPLPSQGMMVYCTECSPMGYAFYIGTSWITTTGNALTVIPNRPTRVLATAGIYSASVSFDSPSTGLLPISQYIVKSTTGEFTATGTSSPIVINGLTNLLSYSFTVTAVAANGTTTAISEVSNSITPLSSAQNKITYNYILSTGQSLSVGAQSTATSTSQPYNNMSLSPTPIGLTLPLIRLQESVLETPSSGLANTLSQLDTNHFPVIIGLHGLAGALYSQIKKTTNSYNNGISQYNNAKSYVESNNGIFKPLGVTVIHGESDLTSGLASTYEANLVQWQNDYQNDTTPATLLPMFISQMNSRDTGEVADAQLSAHMNNRGTIILVGPKYQYTYFEGLHLNTIYYKHLGEMFAKVIKKVALDGTEWNPLMPTTVSRTANIVTISFNIPVGNLAFDTNLVALRSNYGFEFVQTGGSQISITNVELINNSTQVKITLSGTPDGTNARILYAWNCPSVAVNQSCGGALDSTKVGGNLRDSDNSISPATGSTGMPLYNWCVAFNKQL